MVALLALGGSELIILRLLAKENGPYEQRSLIFKPNYVNKKEKSTHVIKQRTLLM